jgi:hypothetical protein
LGKNSSPNYEGKKAPKPWQFRGFFFGYQNFAYFVV